MDAHDPLMTAMFWGGLLVAAIPVLLTLGIGLLVVRRQVRGRGHDHSSPSPPTEPSARRG